MPVADSPMLPRSLEGVALFLDVDGTLLDLAPSPFAVAVPREMPDLLRGLGRASAGATALVTGRRIESVDSLFSHAVVPVAGIHGSEIRLPDLSLITARRSGEMDAARADLDRWLASSTGPWLEDKGLALAVHYRGFESSADRIEQYLLGLASGANGALAVQRGKMVIELRSSETDKGRAVRRLSAFAPFAGRRPLAIGDDQADEAMFRVVNELGGVSIHVGSGEVRSAASHRLDSPASVRRYLRGLASL